MTGSDPNEEGLRSLGRAVEDSARRRPRGPGAHGTRKRVRKRRLVKRTLLI